MCGSVGNSFQFILTKCFGSLRQIEYVDVIVRKVEDENEN